MKQALVFTLISSFAALASAKNLNCRDVNAGPDHGYILTFSRGLTAVKISSQSIAGPMPVATLACEKTGEKVTHPDEMVTVLRCRVPDLADAGYTLSVTTGGFAGITQAHLAQVYIGGAKPVAHFICR